MSLHAKSASLSVPAHKKGHRHRRSAAVSFDWRNMELPNPADVIASHPSSAPATAAGCGAAPSVAVEAATFPGTSPTLTFASSASESSIGEQDATISRRASLPDVVEEESSSSTLRRVKRVAFSDDVQEIPSGEEGDTWMKSEDYSWPVGSATSSDDEEITMIDLSAGGTLPGHVSGPSLGSAGSLLSKVSAAALEPIEALDPASASKPVPGSPVLNKHRRKRSSFLQTTKNVLSRRPSKKRPVSPMPPTIMPVIPLPPPKSNMIDLDIALPPDSPRLKHKKSGSFNNLPPSPVKLKPKVFHRRAGSAPADILFSFSPRPASPDTRKRKMSAIAESPTSIQAYSATTSPGPLSSQQAFHLSLDEMAAMEAEPPHTACSTESSMLASRAPSSAGTLADSCVPRFEAVDLRFYDCDNQSIPGGPGDMLRDESYDASPALAALRALEQEDGLRSLHTSNTAATSQRDSIVSAAGSAKPAKRGWKGVLHRLLR